MRAGKLLVFSALVSLALVAPLLIASRAWASPASAAPAPDPSSTTPVPAPGAPGPAPSPTTTIPANPFPMTPTTAPSGHQQPSLGPDPSPGFFDIGGRITKAINDWFSGLVNDALNPVLDLVGRTILSTPDFTGAGRVHDLWFVSWGIANALFVLLIVAAGALAMGYETFQSSYAVKDLLPRLGLGWVAANASLELAHVGIGAADALSRAVVGQGASGPGALAATHQLVEGALASGGILVTLIGLAVVVLAIGLVGVYVGRVATMVILVAAAPLFLCGHALPQTHGAARLWWRAMIGCLGVQVGQALVLITAVRVFFDADGRRSLGLPGGSLMDLLVVGCLFWLMLRLPTYARRLVFNTRPNAGVAAVRTYVVTRGLRAAKTAAAAL
jgi:hypothetical protein